MWVRCALLLFVFASIKKPNFREGDNCQYLELCSPVPEVIFKDFYLWKASMEARLRRPINFRRKLVDFDVIKVTSGALTPCERFWTESQTGFFFWCWGLNSVNRLSVQKGRVFGKRKEEVFPPRLHLIGRLRRVISMETVKGFGMVLLCYWSLEIFSIL